MTKEPVMNENNWALCEPVKYCEASFSEETIDVTDPWYMSDEYSRYHQKGVNHTITNGKITAKVSFEGCISFFNQNGELLTEEYWRNRNRINRYCVPLRVEARELKCYQGSTDYELTARFDFKFEPRDWPDPEGMIRELKELGIETVVSIWPTIDERSENFGKMADSGYLVSADRGNGIHMTWMGNTVFYDATNPGAREYVWEKCRENYYKYGIKCFWLDEAEPEYGPYDFDNYRYYAGPALQCTNIYPLMYVKGFYDGLKSEGETEVLSLVRCAWAGSQKYGALTWSGDIHSSFRAMREQLQAGLNMSVAGIPWWTSDIGGFLGGDISDPKFRELLVRWFEWGAFCPVFRMHGERSPWHEREEEFINGVRQLTSGQDNEVWSFGEDNFEILKKYLFLRERLRPYIRECMDEASLSGMPVMRPLFFDFYKDKTAWKIEDEYMFGPDILVAPVMEENTSERKVYLPEGAIWTDANTKKAYSGGQNVTVPAPLDIIPVFIRDNKKIDIYL